MSRDLGPARLIVADSRTGRQLQPGQRRIMTDAEWEWINSHVDGQYEHLLFASSLPFLLPYGMHHIEAWSEAVTDGAWGKRLCGARRKGANRGQPRSLGLLSAQLPRVRGPRHRRRHRRARSPRRSRWCCSAATCTTAGCRRFSCRRTHQRPTPRSGRWCVLACARRPGCRANRVAPWAYSVRRGRGTGACQDDTGRHAAAALAAGDACRTSAIRSGRWRSPAARSECASNRCPAAGPNRNCTTVIEHKLL